METKYHFNLTRWLNIEKKVILRFQMTKTQHMLILLLCNWIRFQKCLIFLEKSHTKLATVSLLHAGQHNTWTEEWVAPNCLETILIRYFFGGNIYIHKIWYIIQYGLIEQKLSISRKVTTIKHQFSNATKHLKQQYFWPWIFSMKALFMDHDDVWRHFEVSWSFCL